MNSEIPMRGLARLALMALAIAVLAACGDDADSADDDEAAAETIDDVSADEGAYEDLVEAAQEEGEVVWYTSVPSTPANDIGRAFEEEYGIDAVVMRSGGEDTLQRYLLEADTDHVMNDVLSISDPATILDLTEQDHFDCFKPRAWDELHDWARDEVHECWTANRGIAMAIGYRTDILEDLGADVPESWADLNQPELEGRVAHANPNFSSLIRITTAMLSEDMGWDWYEEFVANDPMLVRGNAQLFDALESGEAAVSAFSTTGRFIEPRMNDDPLDISFAEEGTYTIAAPNAIPAEAPHPNAARLLVDFLSGEEAQQILLDDGQFPARADLDPPETMPSLDEIEQAPIDYRWIIDNADERVERFSEMMGADDE